MFAPPHGGSSCGRLDARRVVGVLAGAWLVLVPAAAGAPARRADGLDPEGHARAEIYADLMRAQVAAHKRDYGTAADEVRKAAELDPQSADLLVHGATLILRGDPAEAERLARRALEIDPAHAGALRFVAERAAARALGPRRDAASRTEAVALLDKLAAAEDEPDPDVLAILIQLHLQAEEFDAATAVARRLATQRPGDPEAVKTLTQLLLHGGQESEALSALLQFVADHPEERALADWAEQLANGLEAWNTVVSVLTARVTAGHGPWETHRFLGEAQLHLGNAALAVPELETAHGDEPSDARSSRDLAIAYRGVGRMADAIDLLEALLREGGEHPLVRELLGEVRAQQGDSAGALDEFDKALAGLSGPSEGAEHRDSIRQRMALLCLSRHQEDRARKLVDAFETDGGPLALEIRARLALRARDGAGARRYAAALEAAGQPGLAALIEGEAAAEEKHWSKAGEKFERAGEQMGPVALRNAAEIYREGGRPEDGLRLLQQWARKEAQRSDARYWLGVYLYELQRYDDAEAELREALRLDAHHAPALNFLGYSLAERGIRLPEALELIQRALALDPWNGAYLDSLGWVYFQMADYDEARSPLERASREMPKDPTILEHLGDLYQRLGQPELAHSTWSRALDAEPEHPEALRRKLAQEPGGHEEALGERPSGSAPRR